MWRTLALPFWAQWKYFASYTSRPYRGSEHADLTNENDRRDPALQPPVLLGAARRILALVPLRFDLLNLGPSAQLVYRDSPHWCCPRVGSLR